jgi:hypothetical protein
LGCLCKLEHRVESWSIDSAIAYPTLPSRGRPMVVMLLKASPTLFSNRRLASHYLGQIPPRAPRFRLLHRYTCHCPAEFLSVGMRCQPRMGLFAFASMGRFDVATSLRREEDFVCLGSVVEMFQMFALFGGFPLSLPLLMDRCVNLLSIC